ncbi:MAG: sigma 54-interacting transcriptional regulator [Gemmatimonadaceae bacterium]
MRTDSNQHHQILPSNFTLDDFHSADPAMRACLNLAAVAARTDLPILVLGESGTGKTLLSGAIHNSSRRAAAPFVSFNAAALSDTLLDSQLFGHEKGAFTGAVKLVKGKFELADRGTLFIDEIADMSSVAQAKILRAVEYGEFERLGSESLKFADVRLISATHLPLQRFVDSDHFRKDLFYRISGITISVPALRDRPADLRSLIAAEISSASAEQGKKIIGLSKSAGERLFAYHWPGNLRELKRVIQTAVAMCDEDVIQADAILLDRADAATPQSPPATANGVPQVQLDLTLRGAVERHIRSVLDSVGGNKRRAAQLLGLSRSTLDRKLSHGGDVVSNNEDVEPQFSTSG